MQISGPRISNFRECLNRCGRKNYESISSNRIHCAPPTLLELE